MFVTICTNKNYIKTLAVSEKTPHSPRNYNDYKVLLEIV